MDKPPAYKEKEDKPTAYNEEEEVLEDEELDIETKRKERGKINCLYKEICKTMLFKGEKGITEVNEPTADKEREDKLESKELENSPKKKTKGKTTELQLEIL